MCTPRVWQVSIASLVPSFKNFWAAPQQNPSAHSGLGNWEASAALAGYAHNVPVSPVSGNAALAAYSVATTAAAVTFSAALSMVAFKVSCAF